MNWSKATTAQPPRRVWGLRRLGMVLVLAMAIIAGLLFVRRSKGSMDGAASAELEKSPSRLSLIQRNLLCRKNLTPHQTETAESLQRTLAQWTQRIRAETRRHHYRYVRNPAEFENSPGFFRMLMVAVVLAEDYGICYDPSRRAGVGETRMDDGFFSDPDRVFLTGLLGPDRTGTCSSLPVLYAAIGRELGYPLKLVTTKGHLFVRWDGDGERFNIEASSHGLNRFSDDYYRQWPFQISKDEEMAEGYLQSLTPEGEFAVFLSIRGMCLSEQGRWGQAADAFRAAARFAPGCRSYKSMLDSLEQRARVSRSADAALAPSQPLPKT